jgi:hypothetical protein
MTYAPHWGVAEELKNDVAVEEGRVRRIEAGHQLPSGAEQAVTFEHFGDVRPPEVDVTDARNVLLIRCKCGWCDDSAHTLRLEPGCDANAQATASFR